MSTSPTPLPVASPTPDRRGVCRFGVFELDLASGELRKAGRAVRLAPQPTRVLITLVERGGRIVSRDELRASIWGNDTFVDFEQGVNFCIKQIRGALGDEADNPRFIETVPRRGYRLIAPIERLASTDAPASVHQAPVVVPVVSVGTTRPAWRRHTPAIAAAALLAVAAVALGLWATRSGPVAPPGRTMIAVLPFDNIGGDRDQDYFAQGFTEELIAQLGRIDSARIGVISRTSTLAYRGTRKSAAEIGRELGVQHLVEGTVRRSGDRVRINAQLIRVSDQSHVWAELYEGQIRDILHLQRELGDAITRQILSTIGSVPRATRGPRDVDPTVYDLYLRARFAWNTRLPLEIANAAATFKDALKLDPSFAPAWAGLADALLIEARSEALEAAERAIELDADLAEAHASKAQILMHLLRWDWAEQEFQRAIDLDPSYAPARYLYAQFLAVRGRCAKADEQGRQGMAVDPRGAIATHVAGVALYYCREYDRALPLFQKALQLDPKHIWSHYRIGLILEQRGEYDAAIAEFERIGTRMRAAHAYARAGRTAEARRIIRATLDSPGAENEAYYLAGAHVGLGEYDEAFKWLEIAIRRQLYDVIFMHTDPRLDPLRSLPRYRELVRLGGWE
jgi:TolB-like protein/DNA-binding winged helix-turn-helix (wHTH) protein/thioredoxin-like negative regulator of GroEL